MIMSTKHTILAATLISALTACHKELDLKYHDIEPLTVIEGELTPDGAKVGITLTTPMAEPMDLSRLTDASVTLEDVTAHTTLTLVPDADGYFSDPNPGIEGHDYRIVVEREGCRYRAVTTFYPPVEIESLDFSWIRMPYDHVAVLQGKFYDDARTHDYYWVKVYRNDKIYLWSEMDDRGADDGIVSFVFMTSRMDTDEEEDDTVLYDGDVVTVTICRISESMHDYLEALRNDSNGPAMFAGDKCLGYFMAASPVSRSIAFHPSEIPKQ